MGFYDGIIGPGTGTFAIIAYNSLMKYDLKTASGNAKALNLASNYAACLTFIQAGTVITPGHAPPWYSPLPEISWAPPWPSKGSGLSAR